MGGMRGWGVSEVVWKRRLLSALSLLSSYHELAEQASLAVCFRHGVLRYHRPKRQG